MNLKFETRDLTDLGFVQKAKTKNKQRNWN